MTRGWALLPDVHLAHHPSVTHEHLHDHSHLKKQTIGIFVKTPKDVALGSQNLCLTPTRGPPRDSYHDQAPGSNPRLFRHPPRPSVPYWPPSPPDQCPQQHGQTSPGPDCYFPPNYRLHQNQESAPQLLFNRSPPQQHAEPRQAPHSYTDVLKKGADLEETSEIKQLLKCILYNAKLVSL